MNAFSFTGNLGGDCRTNEVGGTHVCNFSVACRSGYGQHEQTVWVDCALWGKRGESVAQYLTKGQQVAVTGELAPFGGVKESGLGREGSHHGIEDYLEMKYVCLSV